MISDTIEGYFGKKVPKCYTEKDPMLNPPPDNRITPNPGGMGVTFFEKMKEYSDKTAQIDADTGETMTHGEVLLRSIRVAEHLRNRGCTTDDMVTLCSYNHMNSCTPFLACLYLGVKVSSLDPTLSQSDSTYLLKLVKPKYVFCTPESEEMIEHSLQEAEIDAEIVVYGDTERNTPFAEFLEETGTEDSFVPRHVEDPFETAVVFFSSGTTGLPKGICNSHCGLLAQSAYSGLYHNVQVCLYFTTLYWISGVIMFTWTILYGGARLFCKKLDENTVMKHVEKYKVTMTFFAPTYTYKFTQNPETCNYDTRSLRSVVVGGGPTGEEQMLKFRKLLPYTTVVNNYGMTEVSGIVTMFDLDADADLIESKPLSCGKPVPGFCYRIVDPETGKILGPNQRGELRLKSKYIMNGYYNKPEESKKAWDSEGYLYTGDIAYYDEDYCFYVVDRIKDLLKFQSWHIAPAELEGVILTHPDAKAAVVIGIPDEIDGDLPMGVIILKPRATVTEEEIADYVNERVSDRKKLRGGVKFVKSIPLTPSGKLRRRDVRDWVLTGKI